MNNLLFTRILTRSSLQHVQRRALAQHLHKFSTSSHLSSALLVNSKPLYQLPIQKYYLGTIYTVFLRGFASDNKKSGSDIQFGKAKKPIPTTPTPTTPAQSIWKSSALPKKPEQLNSNYNILDGWDKAIADSVKEETRVFELSNKGVSYRAYFGFIVLNFIFWAFCANTLFMFYLGADDEGRRLRDLYQEKKGEQGPKASFTRTWVDSLLESNYIFLINVAFFMIGLILSYALSRLMRRVVSFIDILPGAKQARIGRINFFGWITKKNAETFDLKDICANYSRRESAAYLTFKIRGKKMPYYVDMQGQFPDEILFDRTVGLYRELKPLI